MVRSHRALRDVVAHATRALSVAPADLAPQILRMQQAVRDADRAMKGLQQELAGRRAAELRRAPETIGAHRVVITHEPSADAAGIKALAQAVAADSDLVVIMVGGGQPAPVVVARGPASAVDAAALVRVAASALGGRGGGKADVAQAGVPARADAIVKILRQQLET
jgi:alanyl-tRNA synthetase